MFKKIKWYEVKALWNLLEVEQLTLLLVKSHDNLEKKGSAA